MTEPTRPGVAAALPVWRAYATAVDPDRAEHIATMTKKALIVQYGTVPPATDKQADPAPRHAAEPDPGHEPDEDVTTGTAWGRVMRDVGQIAKADRNTDQRFNFRGIDATMNAVGPAFRRHGVAVLPIRAEVLESERYQAKSGTAMHGMVTRHDWLILGPDGEPMKYPDGSPIIMQTLGQAADTSDKVASKASSVAYRTALLQSLTVPTGDRDPDADSPERATVDPRQEQWDRIAGLARYARQSPEAIRKHYRDKMGHDIDGAEATVATLTEYGDRLEASFRQQAEAENKTAESGYDAPGAERDSSKAAEPEAPAAAASEPPATEPAPAPAETKPEPTPAPAPAQGRDPRQKLWDDIMASGTRLQLTAGQIRADFSQWALDALGHETEIDGPEATPDVLTRYAHTLKGR